MVLCQVIEIDFLFFVKLVFCSETSQVCEKRSQSCTVS